MKKNIWMIMAVVTAAIFLCGSLPVFAMYSPQTAENDYRDLGVYTKNGELIQKPTAQFAAVRTKDGETVDFVTSYAGYDCNIDFPTLICYVGDVLTFTDMSCDNNAGGSLMEWDWQYSGALGEHNRVYTHNPLPETVFSLTEPGETIFYLCVRNQAGVRNGCCDPWSENGNHQVVGKNKRFPKGCYWYFTAVRVVVQPKREAIVHMRCWDGPQNRIFKEDILRLGELLTDEAEAFTTVTVPTFENYKFQRWNVELPDGSIQYEGNECEIRIGVAGFLPEKYLNIEYAAQEGNQSQEKSRRLEIEYTDTETQAILKEETICDQETVCVNLKRVPGYLIDGWTLQYPNGQSEMSGTEETVSVSLPPEHPEKKLIIYCRPIQNSEDGTEEGELPKPTVTVKPSGACDGVIEWTETDSHRKLVGRNRKGRPIYEICYHTFTYRTVLEADMRTDPQTFKSGYGFAVDVSCRLKTHLAKHEGNCTGWGSGRQAEATMEEPTRATVYLPWTVANRRGTQPASVTMNKNGNLTFTLPENPISEVGTRKIYTPVELSGTAEKPETHNFEVYIHGGGVGKTEFCKKLEGQIIINGDMYEDDFSGAD